MQIIGIMAYIDYQVNNATYQICRTVHIFRRHGRQELRLHQIQILIIHCANIRTLLD